MFPIVLIFLGLTAVLAAGTFVFMVGSVVLAGPQPKSGLTRDWRWRPPLATPTELKRWAAEVAEGITRKFLGQKREAETPVKLVEELLHGATFAINHVPHVGVASQDRHCETAQRETIGVTIPEVLAIADRLRGRREVARRVHDLAAANVDKSGEDVPKAWSASELPCPLLGADGSCESYPVRPLQCRAHCDCGKGACGAPSSSNLVPVEAIAKAVGMGAESGLAQGLAAAGLDSRTYELNSALVVALETRDASDRWLHGDDLFANCRQCV